MTCNEAMVAHMQYPEMIHHHLMIPQFPISTGVHTAGIIILGTGVHTASSIILGTGVYIAGIMDIASMPCSTAGL